MTICLIISFTLTDPAGAKTKGGKSNLPKNLAGQTNERDSESLPQNYDAQHDDKGDEDDQGET